MHISTSLSAIKKTLIAFLQRFHIVIFAVIVLNGLTVVVFLLNGIIVRSGESGDYTPNTTSTTFDRATIERIKELKTRDQANNDLTFPDGRANPFVE